jgi:hypothetical protein
MPTLTIAELICARSVAILQVFLIAQDREKSIIDAASMKLMNSECTLLSDLLILDSENFGIDQTSIALAVTSLFRCG